MDNSIHEKYLDELRNSPKSKIVQDGVVVGITHGSCDLVEALVRRANSMSQHEMDWGYIGGRAIIYTLGDPDKAYIDLEMCVPRVRKL